MPGRIRVLLVVAPTLLRQALAAVLVRRRRLEIVGDAATGAEAIRQARASRPDVVVVDPDTDDVSKLDYDEAAEKHCPGLRHGLPRF